MLILVFNFSDNDITNVVDMTFSVNHDSFGQIQVRELKAGGKEIAVSEANKKEYVQLYVNFRFTHGIEQQFRALQKGFCELVPQHLLASFDEKELELVIGGLGQIDLLDWKANVRLKHCTPVSNIVQWFWRAVESYSEERRARLLQFVTGSSRVPLQGESGCCFQKKCQIIQQNILVNRLQSAPRLDRRSGPAVVYNSPDRDGHEQLAEGAHLLQPHRYARVRDL